MVARGDGRCAARRGVDDVEMHKILTDFRGDTVHASTLDASTRSVR
jgi:hypothetical protein